MLVAGRDSSLAPEAAEHGLDAAAVLIPMRVIPHRLVPRTPIQDAALNAPGLDGVPETVGVVAAIAEQPLRLWQVVGECNRLGLFVDLACGHEEAQRLAFGVGEGVELGVHSAPRASDQAAKASPFYP